MQSDALKQAAVAALEDIKARDITVLDTRRLTSLFDFLIVATGDSSRQVKAAVTPPATVKGGPRRWITPPSSANQKASPPSAGVYR